MTTKMDDWGVNVPTETRQSAPSQTRQRVKEGAQKIADWGVKEVRVHDTEQIKPFSHPDIDPELARWFIANPSLRTSVLSAVEDLRSNLNDIELRAYIKRDMEDPSDECPCIEVKSDIADPEQWLQLKSHVRQIVRSAETGDIMIYTNICRI
ncbi:hypothetical protein [Halorubrum halophilum]|uniref:hypothetical protein n=1 Tax=Halorubrum halophilum TaxID=413816 RepID=UPI00186AF73D|nr:hypothetical protein [Halorubrum halophilum]